MSRARLKNINGLSRIKLPNKNISKLYIKYLLSLDVLIKFFLKYNSPSNFTIMDSTCSNSKNLHNMHAIYPIFRKKKFSSFTKKKSFYRSNVDNTNFFFLFLDSSAIYKKKCIQLEKENISNNRSYNVSKTNLFV